jgi:L,D-transpeptidase ErfK/SrfK
MMRQTCPTGSIPYTIRKGDTLALIAKQYNTSVEIILDANPFIVPTNLYIGQEICVPLTLQYYPTCPTTNYYVVRDDDSFESIANYFNVSYQQLYYSNYGIDPNSLYEDQILCIPVTDPIMQVIVDTNKLSLFLYYNGRLIATYPIEFDQSINVIPKGEFILLNKKVDPGVEFGARYLGLSQAGFGIHGTNTPLFVEAVSTNKSIIMSNQDISDLFNRVTVGSTFLII